VLGAPPPGPVGPTRGPSSGSSAWSPPAALRRRVVTGRECQVPVLAYKGPSSLQRLRISDSPAGFGIVKRLEYESVPHQKLHLPPLLQVINRWCLEVPTKIHRIASATRTRPQIWCSPATWPFERPSTGQARIGVAVWTTHQRALPKSPANTCCGSPASEGQLAGDRRLGREPTRSRSSAGAAPRARRPRDAAAAIMAYLYRVTHAIPGRTSICSSRSLPTTRLSSATRHSYNPNGSTCR
jgi:hypothetical protein